MDLINQYNVGMLFAFSMGYMAAALTVALIVWIKNRR